MEIIAGTLDFELNKDTAVAMGKFDGLHLGHEKLLNEVLAKKKAGLTACVFTFEPSPAVFFGFSDGRELSTKEEKRRVLEMLGVDVLVEFPMTKDTAAMEPQFFVEEVLVKRLHTKWIVAGTDVSFGKKGEGDAQLLEKLSAKYGYGLTTIEKVCLGNEIISSTLVRSKVEEGNMPYAEALLGKPYSIVGKVVHGRALGRKLGMPTVNLIPESGKLLPPCGVYFSSVIVDGEYYPAISNIGYKPTVNSEKHIGVETYIYDFDRDIYEEEIIVYLHEFKRAEMKFNTVEDLKKQMKEDIFAGKEYHLSKNG